jgi:hypothetical protein
MTVTISRCLLISTHRLLLSSGNSECLVTMSLLPKQQLRITSKAPHHPPYLPPALPWCDGFFNLEQMLNDLYYHDDSHFRLWLRRTYVTNLLKNKQSRSESTVLLRLLLTQSSFSFCPRLLFVFDTASLNIGLLYRLSSPSTIIITHRRSGVSKLLIACNWYSNDSISLVIDTASLNIRSLINHVSMQTLSRAIHCFIREGSHTTSQKVSSLS